MGPAASFKLVRLGNVCMAPFFVYAGVVQLNDPDAVVWIVFYLSGAILCAQIALLFPPKSNPRYSSTEIMLGRLLFAMKELTLAIGICTVWLLRRLYKGGWSLDLDWRKELGRENLGLLLYATWFLFVLKAGDIEMARLEKLLMVEVARKDHRSKKSDQGSITEEGSADLMVTTTNGSWNIGVFMITFAVLTLSSAYVVPKFFLKRSDTDGHCSGIGFCPAK